MSYDELVRMRRQLIHRLLNGDLDEATKEQGYRTLDTIDRKLFVLRELREQRSFA